MTEEIIHVFPTAGNAPPYLRMTQAEARLGGRRIPPRDAKTYHKWLRINRYLAYSDALASSMAHLAFDRAPRDRESALRVTVYAWFEDRTHGDPDNVLKGVLDALFEVDKHIVSGVGYDYDSRNPRLVIRITESEAEAPAWARRQG